MNIKYKYGKDFTPEQLKELFSSVGWAWDADHAMTAVKGLERSTNVVSAWDDNKLVGLARSLDDGFWSAVITCIIVHKNYQRNGIGSRMLELLKQEIGDIDCLSVDAFTDEDATFFSKNGFDSDKQVRIFYKFSEET